MVDILGATDYSGERDSSLENELSEEDFDVDGRFVDDFYMYPDFTEHRNTEMTPDQSEDEIDRKKPLCLMEDSELWDLEQPDLPQLTYRPDIPILYRIERLQNKRKRISEEEEEGLCDSLTTTFKFAKKSENSFIGDCKLPNGS